MAVQTDGARKDVGQFFLIGGPQAEGRLFWYQSTPGEYFNPGHTTVVLPHFQNMGSIAQAGNLYAFSPRVHNPDGYAVVTSEGTTNTLVATSTDREFSHVSLSPDKAFLAYVERISATDSRIMLVERRTHTRRELGEGYAGFFLDSTHLIRFSNKGVSSINVVTGSEEELYAHAFDASVHVYQSATRALFVWQEPGGRVTSARVSDASGTYALNVLGTFTGGAQSVYGITDRGVYELYVKDGRAHVIIRNHSGMFTSLPFSFPAGDMRDLANVRQ